MPRGRCRRAPTNLSPVCDVLAATSILCQHASDPSVDPLVWKVDLACDGEGVALVRFANAEHVPVSGVDFTAEHPNAQSAHPGNVIINVAARESNPSPH